MISCAVASWISARVEAIKDLVESRSHNIDPEPESSLFMRADTESEFSIDTAYLDTPLDEQRPSILDSHIQQVEVEIHESTDGGDSELQCPPLLIGTFLCVEDKQTKSYL